VQDNSSISAPICRGELAKLDEDEGNIIGRGGAAPRCHGVKNGLPHFRKWSLGRFAYERCQTFDTKHFFPIIKNLDEAVSVED
jgi:hypothetical protein